MTLRDSIVTLVWWSMYFYTTLVFSPFTYIYMVEGMSWAVVHSFLLLGSVVGMYLWEPKEYQSNKTDRNLRATLQIVITLSVILLCSFF
ncbi:MAG: hypothetical protein ACTSPB_20580, partial [Candidatus Thorarchaeota archaeon]